MVTAGTNEPADKCATRQVIVLKDWFTKLPEHMRFVALHDIAAEGKYPGMSTSNLLRCLSACAACAAKPCDLSCEPQGISRCAAGTSSGCPTIRASGEETDA